MISLESFRNCFISGQYVESYNDVKNCYIFGKYPDEISIRNNIIEGYIKLSTHTDCFIEGWHEFVFSTKNIKLKYHTNSDRNLYLNGKYLSQKNSIIEGYFSIINLKKGYIDGICFSEKQAIAYHTIKINDIRNCFIINYPFTQKTIYINSVRKIQNEKCVFLPYESIYKTQRKVDILKYTYGWQILSDFTTPIEFSLDTTTALGFEIIKEISEIPFKVLIFNYEYFGEVPFLILDNYTNKLKDFVVLRCISSLSEEFEFYIFPLINQAYLWKEVNDNQIDKIYLNDIEITKQKQKFNFIKKHSYKLKIRTKQLSSNKYDINHFLRFEYYGKVGTIIIKTYYVE